MSLTPTQCRAARAGLEWSREHLAQLAQCAERTVTDFERRARDPHGNNKTAMRQAFEKAGVTFDGSNGIRFEEKPNAT
jgi:DNA-binding transcriptional regulator YiaG